MITLRSIYDGRIGDPNINNFRDDRWYYLGDEFSFTQEQYETVIPYVELVDLFQ